MIDYTVWREGGYEGKSVSERQLWSSSAAQPQEMPRQSRTAYWSVSFCSTAFVQSGLSYVREFQAWASMAVAGYWSMEEGLKRFRALFGSSNPTIDSRLAI
jgi:hypothetical protein